MIWTNPLENVICQVSKDNINSIDNLNRKLHAQMGLLMNSDKYLKEEIIPNFLQCLSEGRKYCPSHLLRPTLP